MSELSASGFVLVLRDVLSRNTLCTAHNNITRFLQEEMARNESGKRKRAERLYASFRCEKEQELSTWYLDSDNDSLNIDNGLLLRTHGKQGRAITFTLSKAAQSHDHSAYLNKLISPLENELMSREMEHKTLLDDVTLLAARVATPGASEPDIKEALADFERLTSCARNHATEINMLKARLAKLPSVDETKAIVAHRGQTFTAELGRLHHFTFEDREVWLLIEDPAAPTTVCNPAVLSRDFIQQQLQDLGYGRETGLHDELVEKHMEGPVTWVDFEPEDTLPHPEEQNASVLVANWQHDEPSTKRKM
jgi:hypothetical protein